MSKVLPSVAGLQRLVMSQETVAHELTDSKVGIARISTSSSCPSLSCHQVPLWPALLVLVHVIPTPATWGRPTIACGVGHWSQFPLGSDIVLALGSCHSDDRPGGVIQRSAVV